MPKNLIKAIVGQNVSCSPRQPGISKAGGGGRRKGQPETHTAQPSVPMNSNKVATVPGGEWQLAGAVLPEGVAGT